MRIGIVDTAINLEVMYFVAIGETGRYYESLEPGANFRIWAPPMEALIIPVDLYSAYRMGLISIQDIKSELGDRIPGEDLKVFKVIAGVT